MKKHLVKFDTVAECKAFTEGLLFLDCESEGISIVGDVRPCSDGRGFCVRFTSDPEWGAFDETGIAIEDHRTTYPVFAPGEYCEGDTATGRCRECCGTCGTHARNCSHSPPDP